MPEFDFDLPTAEFSLYNALIGIGNSSPYNDATKHSMSVIWSAIHSLRTSRGLYGVFTYE